MLRRELLKYAQIAALSSIALTIFGSPAKKLRSISIIDDLERKIPLLMQQARIPGLAVAVVSENEIIWHRGFGVNSTKKGQKVGDRTVFAAASLAKPLFACAVLKLAETGQIDLDKPLSEYTAKPYIKDPRLDRITARIVLSHTTGFPNWSGDAPVWIERTPGTKFGYSGEGYLYLQRVVEAIAKQQLQDYLHSNLLLPLGMKDSSYIWEDKYRWLAADGHDRAGKAIAMSKPKQAMSAGSLRTTAVDYGRFLLAMLNPGSNIDSPFLTRSSLEDMLRPQVKINQHLCWGLGWGLERTSDGNFFWHWGDGGTNKSFTMGSIEQKMAIVILTNSQNGLKICPDIVGSVIKGQHPAFKFPMIRY